VIVPEGDPLFAFAGLWEAWRDKAAGESAEWIRTCTIVTGKPNELVAPIHNRMLVVLPSEAWSTWLGEEPAGADYLKALLKPLAAQRKRAYPISSCQHRVGRLVPAHQLVAETLATKFPIIDAWGTPPALLKYPAWNAKGS
jgi:putative SOS response-associated peptidase YedK